MIIKTTSRFTPLIAAVLALLLALPASAKDWDFYRARTLRPNYQRFTTLVDGNHTMHVSVCAPREAFSCMRIDGVATLAVPKGWLPSKWQFEGVQYTLVQKDAGMMLLGAKVPGAYIRAVNAKGEATEFYYSYERGFFAFQWMPDPKEKPHVFISAEKCAPGASEDCRE